MYKSLIGEKITIVVSSRGDNLLEYIGTLSSETDDTVELKNVNISLLMLNFQKILALFAKLCLKVRILFCRLFRLNFVSNFHLGWYSRW